MNLVYRSPQNPNSHLTIKERRYPSYPVKQLLMAGLIEGRVLDFGCGPGTDVVFLQEKNVDITGYDPYYAPEIPSNRFDTILCAYVLNVLLPEEQVHVLMAVSELLQPGGKAYFAVRRDIRQNGFRTHIKRGVEVYQCKVILPYKSIHRSEHCEIYQYHHYNRAGKTGVTGCSFCQPGPDVELITESATAYAVLSLSPQSVGHALVIPKRHVERYSDLSEHAKTACRMVGDRVMDILKERYQPSGFEVVFDSGKQDDLAPAHTHIHIIPQYNFAQNNPL